VQRRLPHTHPGADEPEERVPDETVGHAPLKIPKLRQGSYFPHFLLEPRGRSERALVAVVVASYVPGVSTRKVEHLVEATGLRGILRSQVSEPGSSSTGS